jgi:glycosyltransferase involved in cell wall biosynthesis
MHILHITPAFSDPTNGMAVAVREACAGLHARGVTVTVAAVEDVGAVLRSAPHPCRILTALPSRMPLLRQWQFAPMLRQNIHEAFPTPPDVIHAHGLWLYPQLLARRLAREWRRPLVLSLHGMLEPWRWRHSAWKKRPLWWLSEHATVGAADLLAATSKQEAWNLQARGFRNPVEVIPLGVEVPAGRQARISTAAPDSRRTCLFLSRLHPCKGLRLLITAVARLRPAGWRFVIAGPDENGHRAEVERLAGRLGVRSWFVFTGPVAGDAKWDLYADSDLFVLPSHNENFGLVIAEALACGVPVVTTTQTPWGDVVRKRCGWCCPATADALAGALGAAAAAPPGALREMGARGREWMAAEFTWPRHAARLIECYARLLPR